MKTVSKKLLSILLVAILLVSAIPFQAFADAHASTHVINWEPVDAYTHDGKCADTTCDQNGNVVMPGISHDWNNGVCSLCNYICTHDWSNKDGKCKICGIACPTHRMDEAVAAVNPGCETPGSTAFLRCATCGKEEGGATLNATGHSWVGQVCQNCGATQNTLPNTLPLYLIPNPGTINKGAVSAVYYATDGGYLVNLPQPDPLDGYIFNGWRTEDGRIIYPNSSANVTYDFNMGDEWYAVWVADTKHVEVYAVLNSNYSSPVSGCVWAGEVPSGANLLDYLKGDTIVTAVNNALATHPGYSWDRIYRDRLGNALADGTPNQAQNVYVNFASVPYTLYFDADGGTVAPTSKTVYKGSKVGTLPTPVKNGMVFLGWRDTTDNTLYTADTIYNKAGDGMVKAVWKEEAKVYLRVYLNKNFDTPDRLLEVNSYVVDDHISWSAIDAMLRKYYSPAPGSTMVVNGLFDVNTWGGYRANPNQERKSDIRVAANSGTEIYVMITGVGSGTTVVPTTPTSPVNPTVPANGFWVRDLNGNLTWYPAGSTLPAGTGYWVLDASGNPNIWVMTSGSTIPTYIYIGTNPKTGDTAKIEIAAAIMVLAAAALVTVMALRKKKSV